MKKYLFSMMLLAGSMMAIMSCSKDDSNPTHDAKITGTWNLSKSVEYTTVDGKIRVGPETDDLSDENVTLILNDDKTFQTTTQGILDLEGHYTYANGKLKLDYGGGDIEIAKVKTLSDKSLILSYEDDDSANGKTIIEVTEEHFTR